MVRLKDAPNGACSSVAIFQTRHEVVAVRARLRTLAHPMAARLCTLVLHCFARWVCFLVRFVQQLLLAKKKKNTTKTPRCCTNKHHHRTRPALKGLSGRKAASCMIAHG